MANYSIWFRKGVSRGEPCSIAVRQAVRATDIAARYGGEEIAVVLPSTDTAGAVEVAEKVRSAIEALKLTHEDRPDGGKWVTASLGAARRRNDADAGELAPGR